MIALLVWAVVATIVAAGAVMLAVAASVVRGQEHTMHAREIERIEKHHVLVLERLSNMMAYGTPIPREAVVSDPEPDAETVVRRNVREDQIKQGVLVLSREYERMGLKVSEEDVREEVLSMLGGISPKAPDDLVLAVKS